MILGCIRYVSSIMFAVCFAVLDLCLQTVLSVTVFNEDASYCCISMLFSKRSIWRYGGVVHRFDCWVCFLGRRFRTIECTVVSLWYHFWTLLVSNDYQVCCTVRFWGKTLGHPICCSEQKLAFPYLHPLNVQQIVIQLLFLRPFVVKVFFVSFVLNSV